jgi:hypothetical protein
MPVLRQHLDDAARDAILALDRLIRIGVRADRDRLAAITRRCELALQQLRRVLLVEELRLEIEARREIHVGVRRTGITVVTDHAVRNEVAGPGRDVEQVSATCERFQLDHLELRSRLHCLRLDAAFARNRWIERAYESQLFA